MKTIILKITYPGITKIRAKQIDDLLNAWYQSPPFINKRINVDDVTNIVQGYEDFFERLERDIINDN